jgi:hypothetical protein
MALRIARGDPHEDTPPERTTQRVSSTQTRGDPPAPRTLKTLLRTLAIEARARMGPAPPNIPKPPQREVRSKARGQPRRRAVASTDLSHPKRRQSGESRERSSNKEMSPPLARARDEPRPNAHVARSRGDPRRVIEEVRLLRHTLSRTKTFRYAGSHRAQVMRTCDWISRKRKRLWHSAF